MLWVPTASELVVHCAVRLAPDPVSATAEQPAIKLPASVNVTLPVGALPVTVAVKVTDAASATGFGELESVVVLGALLTTCDSGTLAEAALFASPL